MMRADNIAIRTSGLTRYFGHKAALRGLTLDIPRGQVTALVGHNGAGKTTLIRMLLGLLPPTRGRSELLGHDSQSLTPEVRTRVGYLAEGHFLWGWMRVRDTARLQRETFPRWDQPLFDAMLKFFGVTPDARVRQISRGQRAGVSLAMTLATDPELLILDDPSMGLDPVARRAFWWKGCSRLLGEMIVQFSSAPTCLMTWNDWRIGSPSSATANCWWTRVWPSFANGLAAGRSMRISGRSRQRRSRAWSTRGSFASELIWLSPIPIKKPWLRSSGSVERLAAKS